MRSFLRAGPRLLLAAAVFLLAGAGLALAGSQAEKGGDGPGAEGRGVLVAQVLPGSPAQQAGIARGDIILEVAGRPVDSPEQLRAAVAERKPGEALKLKVRHGDRVRSLAVTLADQDGRAVIGVVPVPLAALEPGAQAPLPSPGSPALPDSPGGRFFLRSEGALVAKVAEDGPAAKAGITAGDLILSVDGTAVGAEESLAGLIAAKKAGDAVTLSVQSPGAPAREVKVTLGKKPGTDSAWLGVEYTAAPPRGPWDGRGGGPFEGFGMTSGVLVARVAEDGPAARAGVQQNDLITAVEGVRVSSPQAVSEAVAARAPGEKVTLTVTRMPDAKEMKLEVTLGENPQDKAKGYLGVSLSRFMGFQGPERPDTWGGATPMPRRGMPWFRAPGQPGQDSPAPNPPGI
jgi:S1-C subfamily serine protease